MVFFKIQLIWGKVNDYYFIHHLYNHITLDMSSNYFNMSIKPIIEKMKMKSLIRIKCNMYLISTEKAQKHPI